MAAKRKQSPMMMPLPQNNYPSHTLSDEIYKTIEANIEAQVKEIIEKNLKVQDAYMQNHKV